MKNISDYCNEALQVNESKITIQLTSHPSIGIGKTNPDVVKNVLSKHTFKVGEIITIQGFYPGRSSNSYSSNTSKLIVTNEDPKNLEFRWASKTNKPNMKEDAMDIDRILRLESSSKPGQQVILTVQ